MNVKSFSLKVAGVTLLCFGASYLFSTMPESRRGEPYPVSIFKAYAEGSGEIVPVAIRRTFPAQGLKEIQIQTTGIDVEFRLVEADQISVSLKGGFRLSGTDREAALQSAVKEDRLVLKTWEGGDRPSIDFRIQFGPEDGKLIVEMPRSVQALTLKTVSGHVDLDSVKLRSVQVETVSGDLKVKSSQLGSIDLKGVSGKVEVAGDVDVFQGKTISGDMELKLGNPKPFITLSSTSGDSRIEFSARPSAVVEFSTVSGSVDVGKELSSLAPEGRKVSFKVGSGEGKVSAQTISGDLSIHVKKP